MQRSAQRGSCITGHRLHERIAKVRLERLDQKRI